VLTTHQTAEAPGYEAAPGYVKAKRILLAEDDGEMRDLLIEVLEADGYEVMGTSDGLELLTNLDEGAPQALNRPVEGVDMIITDIRMPWVNGLDVLRILRERDREVPVLLITAFGDERTHGEAHRLGASAVLDKPFDVDVLRDVVNRLAAKGAGGDPVSPAGAGQPE
jgi:CheY-like chemotaxis protein